MNSDIDLTGLVPQATRLSNVIAGKTDPGKRQKELMRVAEGIMKVASGTKKPAGLQVATGLFDDLENIPPVPTVGIPRTDGLELLYGGSITWLSAEPGSGKSFMSTASTLDMARTGKHVLYLDFESTTDVFRLRLAQLGALSNEESEKYIHYVEMSSNSFSSIEDLRDNIAVTVKSTGSDVIIVDGFSILVASLGLEENSNTDVSKLGRALLDLVSDGKEKAMLIIDHIAKPQQGQSASARKSPRGASSKTALPALSLIVDVAVNPHVGVNGILHLRIVKDRHGVIGSVGDRAATVYFNPADRPIGGSLDIVIDPPEAGKAGKPLFRAGAAVNAMKALHKSAGKSMTTGQLAEHFGGRTKWNSYGKEIIDTLVKYDHIRVENGTGRTIVYTWQQSLTQDDIDRIEMDMVSEKMGVENPF